MQKQPPCYGAKTNRYPFLAAEYVLFSAAINNKPIR
jgi:hypothetical protein